MKNKDQRGCATGWPEKKKDRESYQQTFYEILIEDTAVFHELIRIDQPQFHHLVKLCPVRCRGKIAGKELQAGYTGNSVCLWSVAILVSVASPAKGWLHVLFSSCTGEVTILKKSHNCTRKKSHM